MFWNWRARPMEEIPHRLREIVEMVMICLKEIGYPQDLETLLIKFFGPALKILEQRNEQTDTNVNNSRL